MQKIINVLALASTVVSVTVVGVSGYVSLNREAIIEDIKEAMGLSHITKHTIINNSLI